MWWDYYESHATLNAEIVEQRKYREELRDFSWKKLRTLIFVQDSINWKSRSFNAAQKIFIKSLNFILWS